MEALTALRTIFSVCVMFNSENDLTTLTQASNSIPFPTKKLKWKGTCDRKLVNIVRTRLAFLNLFAIHHLNSSISRVFTIYTPKAGGATGETTTTINTEQCQTKYLLFVRTNHKKTASPRFHPPDRRAHQPYSPLLLHGVRRSTVESSITAATCAVLVIICSVARHLADRATIAPKAAATV